MVFLTGPSLPAVGTAVILSSIRKDLARAREMSSCSNRSTRGAGTLAASLKSKWDEPLKAAGWGTITTKVAPNNLVISGYRLQELIEHSNLLETAHLLVWQSLLVFLTLLLWLLWAATIASREARPHEARTA